MLKPHLACDWSEARVERLLKERGYVIVLPKIDGVRGCNLAGRMTGRSLKDHGNKFITRFYSDNFYLGFDGELAAQSETHPDLCRLTSSAVGTHEGEPYTVWHIFDWLREGIVQLPYEKRLEALAKYLTSVNSQWTERRVRPISWFIAHDMESVQSYDDHFLDLGYEGSIVRDPMGMHKNGRCTEREGAYLRIKRFIEVDALVLDFQEGETNTNVATLNPLGQTERSTHQENMIPNGMVGNMTCRLLEDVVYRGTKLFNEGEEVTVAPGRMTHDDRKAHFLKPSGLIGHRIKVKTFPVGVKDKMRFPTYQSHRIGSDSV